MIKHILFCILFLFASLTHADNRTWTDDEKAWGYTALALTVVDWGQTRDITQRYNEGFYERNPILGRHPSIGQVNTHFAIGIPVMFLIADNLNEYRKPFLQTISIFELICVGNNLGIGLRVRF